MLTLEDCIALSDLTKDEVSAIAHHEHLPQIVAAELGHWLVHLPGGKKAIRAMIRDDINEAQSRGDNVRTATLKLVLQDFVKHCHDDAAICD